MALNDVEAIANLARRFSIRGAGNLLFSCRDADVDLEFSAAGNVLLPPCVGHRNASDMDSSLLAHTNHPVGEESLPFALPEMGARGKGSVQRLEQLNEGLRHLPKNPDAEAFRQMLSRHNPNGESLCRHTEHEELIPITTASLLADPAAGILYATKRQPCLRPFFPYSLD